MHFREVQRGLEIKRVKVTEENNERLREAQATIAQFEGDKADLQKKNGFLKEQWVQSERGWARVQRKIILLQSEIRQLKV